MQQVSKNLILLYYCYYYQH